MTDCTTTLSGSAELLPEYGRIGVMAQDNLDAVLSLPKSLVAKALETM